MEVEMKVEYSDGGIGDGVGGDEDDGDSTV